MKNGIQHELYEEGLPFSIESVKEIGVNTVFRFKNPVNKDVIEWMDNRFKHGISISETDRNLVIINTPAQDSRTTKYTIRDWNCLFDASLTATGRELNTRDLKKMYRSLPEGIQKYAKKYGMTGDDFRNMVIAHLKHGSEKFQIFFTGVVSTPNSVGVWCVKSEIVICEIETSKPSGTATRKAYEKTKMELNIKYKDVLND